MHTRFLLHMTMAAALLFSACSTDLEVPFPKHDPKLTLNTFLTEGKPVDLYLTRSFGTLEDVTVDKILVRDAQVELFRNGVSLGNMVFVDTLIRDTLFSYTIPRGPGLPDSTIYYTEENPSAKYLPAQPILPNAGESYRFVVTHPTYGTATAETTIPARPVVQGLQVKRDSIVTRDFIDGYQDKWTVLKVLIDDPAGETNYYNFNALFRYRYPVVDFPEADTTYGWDWAYTAIERDAGGAVYGIQGPLADTEIDGTLGTLYTWLRLPGCCGYTDERDEENYEYIDLAMQVISMTEAYARFQEKLQLQRNNRLDGIESAFLPTEPVVIPSNVEGGYGVVGAFNVTTVRIGL